MNLLQLVLKQMRQRALGTALTLLSVLLGVALASSIVIVLRGADNLLGQKSFGYDIIIGNKSSPLQLVVNTVYHISNSPGNINYSVYEDLDRNPLFRRYIRVAVPIGVGDSYKGFHIVGTLPRILGFDDTTLEPKTGYDAMGRPLAGFLPPETSDADVEASGKQKRSGVFEYRTGLKFILAQGKPFHRDRFEAVIGSEVAEKTGLKIGDTFQATHGFPAEGSAPDIHEEKWTVTGILEPTRTANDRCLFIGLTSFYTMAEHGDSLIAQGAVQQGLDPAAALKAFEQMKKQQEAERAAATQAAKPVDPDDHSEDTGGHAGHHHHHHENYSVDDAGNIILLPEIVKARQLSAIMVKTRSGGVGIDFLKFIFRSRPDATAVNPADEMRAFFNNFISTYSIVLLAVSFLVTIVAAIGILVSIYNSVAARMKEIAILRALGATRTTVLAMICTEAGLIGLFGSIGGVLMGHGIAAIGSNILERQIGTGIPWQQVSPVELGFIGGAVILAVLAGLVPALKAYRVPVATNLTA